MITAIAKEIQLLILDNDGVLTDGKIYFSNTGEQMLAYHIHDGMGIKHAQQSGIEIAVISGRDSQALRFRLSELSISHIFLGQHDKMDAYKTLLADLQLSPENVAYCGDDLPDIPVMKKVALPIAVANAIDEVKKIALYCTEKRGGHGAVREICDLLCQNRQRQLAGVLKHP